MPGKSIADERKRLKSGKFGINLLRQARVWEADFFEDLAAGKPTAEVYAIFIERLKWLQHERLVHLLVLMIAVIALLISFGLALFVPEAPAVWLLTLILLGLTMAYIFYYFKLENLVQHWYLIENEILKCSRRDE